MSNDMVVIDEPRGVTVFDQNAGDFRGALARRGDNRKTLIEWVRQALVEGVDFGRIHMVKKDKCPLGSKCKNDSHFSKPVLFKPGSEKICGMLGVTPTFPRLHDYEQMVIEGRDIAHIMISCHILGVDRAVVSVGVGARSLVSDNGDLNKSLKMACKSAAIDATLRMAGLSEIFTQDLGDPRANAEANDDPQAGESATERTASKPAAQTTGGGNQVANAKQLKLIRVKLDQAEISAEECCEQFSLESLAQCPFTAVNDILAWISKHSKDAGAPQ
jgi:hypothetical protein